jgi:hypothetical protein
MTKSIDLKSFLLGGLLALVVMFALGAAPRLASPHPVERYALAVACVPGGEDYVLDTVNGQVWPRHVRGRLDTSFYTPKIGAQKPAEPNEPDTR